MEMQIEIYRLRWVLPMKWRLRHCTREVSCVVLLLLRKALFKYRDTSLADRLQKHLSPAVARAPYARAEHARVDGTKPSPVASWKGKPVLLFFWHWCADCKWIPILAKLAAEMEPKGLIVVAPTRRYGFTAQEEHASAATETAFIGKLFAKYYAGISGLQVPVDEDIHRFGASTTPTIVLVNRAGH